MNFGAGRSSGGTLDFRRVMAFPDRINGFLQKTGVEKNPSLDEVAKLVYNFFTRHEESQSSTDRWGRFPHSQNSLVRFGFDQEPILDQIVSEVTRQLGIQQDPIWPEQKKMAVCLTHDVDLFDGRSYLWLRKATWWFKMVKGKLVGPKSQYEDYLRRIKYWQHIDYDANYAFDSWMDLESRYGFRSTFFFFGLEKSLSREGRLYSCHDPRVRDVVRRLNQNGWEVGLHGAYYGHLDAKSLSRQKKALEEALEDKVLGCRHHFLRVKFPESWTVYASAGFKYSANMGWSGGVNGFRAGTCFPYRCPISSSKEGSCELWEVPFELMDQSRIDDPKSYIRLFEDYLEKILKVGGCLVLDFHQEYFDAIEAPGVNQTYRSILDILSADDEIWVAPVKEVVSHLETRTQSPKQVTNY